MKILHCRLPGELHQWLKKESKNYGLTMTGYIIYMLREKMKEER